MKTYKVAELDDYAARIGEIIPGLIGKTREQCKLFEFLARYYTDGKTALMIINGGYLGYCYGAGGYVNADNNEMDGQEVNLISDGSLEHAYYVGAMI